MGHTELPWLIFGRKTRPFSLAVSLADLVIAWGLLVSRNGPGDRLDGGAAGNLVGALALLGTAALWAGFWARSDRAMQAGLLTSAFVWGARAAFIVLDQGVWSQSALLSACWVVASSGAYLLERTTGSGGHARSET